MESNFNYVPIAGTKNRVVVLPFPSEEKTESGLYIPDNAKEKPMKGTVVSVSEKDEEGKSPVIKAGDIVLYGKYAGQEITLDGKDYLVMREADILLKIK